VPDNIVLITTDQQRYDSLGVHGNETCRTPTLDALAASGLDFQRAHVQNVLCTPSRSTILTGQQPGTHGVWTNGVQLPVDAPSVATVLGAAGYRTAQLGKLHYEPQSTFDSWLAETGAGADWHGPYRGFEHIEHVDHFRLMGDYVPWLRERLPEEQFQQVLAETFQVWSSKGGDTGAPQSVYSVLPAAVHNTAWIVERTLAWLDTLDPEEPFFCWVSFDDPHHPFNPPADHGRRHDWREVPLPNGLPADATATAAVLDGKPAQYGAYWRGEMAEHEGSGGANCPRDLTTDQWRELSALTYGMIELIDEQVGRLQQGLADRGLTDNTHVVFTSDHGELMGECGLILKGPFHLQGLLRVSLLWQAPGRAPGVIADPVGLVDLAPTFCAIARVEQPEFMDGAPLPAVDGSRERVLTAFDSAFRDELKLRSLYRDGWLVTSYPDMDGVGELYDLHNDPYQYVNLWEDPTYRGWRDDLLADLRDHMVEDPRAERLTRWTFA
jgi:arylsulfatase A-like enzyme